ncbi:hypothetical protein HDV00_006279 [Rhizophlyctis rosea]|nr:hypothetical protein HDV00_006279 [Rhizophlyctis rosea]
MLHYSGINGPPQSAFPGQLLSGPVPPEMPVLVGSAPRPIPVIAHHALQSAAGPSSLPQSNLFAPGSLPAGGGFAALYGSSAPNPPPPPLPTPPIPANNNEPPFKTGKRQRRDSDTPQYPPEGQAGTSTAQPAPAPAADANNPQLQMLQAVFHQFVEAQTRAGALPPGIDSNALLKQLTLQYAELSTGGQLQQASSDTQSQSSNSSPVAPPQQLPPNGRPLSGGVPMARNGSGGSRKTRTAGSLRRAGSGSPAPQLTPPPPAAIQQQPRTVVVQYNPYAGHPNSSPLSGAIPLSTPPLHTAQLQQPPFGFAIQHAGPQPPYGYQQIHPHQLHHPVAYHPYLRHEGMDGGGGPMMSDVMLVSRMMAAEDPAGIASEALVDGVYGFGGGVYEYGGRV